MSKRRLSKQQSARINQRRQVNEGAREGQEQLGAEQEGLVISHLRNQADIEPIAGGPIVRCHLRANLGPIVAGDRVLWQPGDSAGVVSSVFSRTSQLQRPDSYGKLKLIAANVDLMIITIAPEPPAHDNLIDRYLLLAACFGLNTIIVLNKADLLAGQENTQMLLHRYQQLGYQTFQISAKQESSLQPLKAYLSTVTSIFVGQSGVGKSSIIQTLLPDEQIKIGDLSTQVKKGRHTTTHARLYHFPFGGHCIDSPGIRELGLWHLNADQVILGFPEFQQYIEQCRFRDCSHRHEPGCALLDAVAAKQVSLARFASYQNILATIDDVHVHSQNLT